MTGGIWSSEMYFGIFSGSSNLFGLHFGCNLRSLLDCSSPRFVLHICSSWQWTTATIEIHPTMNVYELGVMLLCFQPHKSNKLNLTGKNYGGLRILVIWKIIWSYHRLFRVKFKTNDMTWSLCVRKNSGFVCSNLKNIISIFVCTIEKIWSCMRSHVAQESLVKTSG